MMLNNVQTAPEVSLPPAWPTEVGVILSAMEAGAWPRERRQMRRFTYHVRAILRLFTDEQHEEKILYTRDVNPRSVGFLTQHRLALGFGGSLQIPYPNGRGRCLVASCTVLRCAVAAPGWYEGALYFNRDRPEFRLPEQDDFSTRRG